MPKFLKPGHVENREKSNPVTFTTFLEAFMTPLRIFAMSWAGVLLLIFAASLYLRLKLAKFAQFAALTLTNKYFVVSVSAGMLSISCKNKLM